MLLARDSNTAVLAALLDHPMEASARAAACLRRSAEHFSEIILCFAVECSRRKHPRYQPRKTIVRLLFISNAKYHLYCAYKRTRPERSCPLMHVMLKCSSCHSMEIMEGRLLEICCHIHVVPSQAVPNGCPGIWKTLEDARLRSKLTANSRDPQGYPWSKGTSPTGANSPAHAARFSMPSAAMMSSHASASW